MTAKLTFDDEFNSLSLWNGTSGTWATTSPYVAWNGNGSSLPSNGELEWYINNNYAPTASVKPWTVNNGVLTLSADKVDPSIAQYLGYTKSGLPALGSYKYTSGMIETKNSFSQQYGYFEMRAQLPAGDGLWPGFWLLRSDLKWPPELDVVEALGKDTANIYTTVHTAETGHHTRSGHTTDVGNYADGFHTYGVDWEADKITFYYDHKQIFQVDTPADMHSPMFILANLAMGGSWAGAPDASTHFPAQMKIDYIRAWDSNPLTNGGAPPPSGPPASGPETLTAPAGGGTLQGGDGDDRLTGAADGPNHLYGGAGADQIIGGGAFDVMNGNMGNDTLHGGDGGDWVSGGKDEDVLFGEAGADTLNGNIGNDTVDGGAGNDVLRGGQNDDSLSGGDGDDWLSGDKGSDTLTGGAGADTFHLSAGSGVDRVTDFHVGEGDRVQVDPGAHYMVAQSGADVVVNLGGGDELILTGVQMSSLPIGWIFGA